MSTTKSQITAIIGTVIATIIIFVGATYAFFNITVGGKENSSLTIITEDLDADFSITKTCNLNLEIDLEDMRKNDGTPSGVPIEGDTCSMTASMTTEKKITCKYQTKYIRTSSDVFTYSEENINRKAESILNVTRTLATGVTITSSTMEEQIDTTGISKKTIDEGTITWNAGVNDVGLTYSVQPVFKNYNFMQNQNANKNVSANVELNIYDCDFGDEPYEAPKAIVLTNDLNSNGKADEGDKVCIDTECFYVISNNDGTVKALAEWNLLVGNQFDGSTVTPLANPTGMQSETAKGFHYAAGTTTAEYPSIGTVAFSSTNYWPNENGTIIDITDSRNTIYPYLTAYKTSLEGLGANISDVTLITKQEIEALINDGNSLSIGYMNTIADAKGYSWLYNTSYCTRAAFDDIYVWYVLSDSGLSNYYYYSDFIGGVRPVIVFLESNI